MQSHRDGAVNDRQCAAHRPRVRRDGRTAAALEPLLLGGPIEVLRRGQLHQPAGRETGPPGPELAVKRAVKEVKGRQDCQHRHDLMPGDEVGTREEYC